MVVDISWVDEFVRSISEYVYVRETDSLLILLPNQAYKLNSTGIAILKRMLSGAPIAEVLAAKSPGLAQDPEVLEQVHHFFCDLRALVMGCMGEGTGRLSVEDVPFERPHNTLPVLSEVALTYRCNLSCQFCYAGCKCTKKSASAEMSTAEVKRVLEVIRNEAEVPSVSWTGGEPTLREDLVELTKHASSLGMRVNLITNGSLLNKGLVSAIAEAGLRSAQVSLEGPSSEVHDGLTQVPGSFEQTVSGINLLRDAGLHVHTNTTLNKLNAPHIKELVEFLVDLNMERFSMNLVIPCGSATDADVVISYANAGALVESVRKHARKAGIKFLWYSPTPYCIYNPVAAALGSKSCAACDGLLSVAPNGDVLPCSSVPKSVGNLLSRKFTLVWNSRRARYWREKRYAHKLCQKCESFDVCTGACPIYWNAMGYRELQHARRQSATA
jgi:radical SAM protein with 4Fe4S-binding SPASM domain